MRPPIRSAPGSGPRATKAWPTQGDRALDAGRLDLGTVLALQYESGSIAATQGRRLILFLGLNAAIRRAIWEFGTAEIQRQGLGHEGYVELGEWLVLTTEMSSLAVGEGYRATERELLARDAAARRAAIDELLGAVPAEGRAASRLRRLAMRYGLDPDASYRVAAILPGPDADPTPEQPGIDDADLETMARRIDGLLRRPGRHDGAGTGIRVPLALTWRGAIVAILGPDPREWQRLQEAVAKVFGSGAPSWIAIATMADGVTGLARSLAELQEGLRVADGIDRRGVIDDLSELGIERLLLSDPDLAAVIVDRELGPLLADATDGRRADRDAPGVLRRRREPPRDRPPAPPRRPDDRVSPRARRSPPRPWLRGRGGSTVERGADAPTAGPRAPR